jgi:hypothetical protein
MEVIFIAPDWLRQGSSETAETLFIEIHERLHDAPNVLDYHLITDSHMEEAIGFAVETTTGRTFIKAGDSVGFSGMGNFTLIS